MQTLQEELCACRKELDEKSAAVMRAAQDRAELAKDKAALEVKLNFADRKACSVTEELVALRSVYVRVPLVEGFYCIYNGAKKLLAATDCANCLISKDL